MTTQADTITAFEKRIATLEKRISTLEKHVDALVKSHAEPSVDSIFEQAIQLIWKYDAVSASFLQRKLSIGYARAARLIDQLEENGFIGPGIGTQPRKVLPHD